MRKRACIAAFLSALLAGCSAGAGRSLPPSASTAPQHAGFPVPKAIRAAVPPKPPGFVPAKPSTVRRTAGAHAAFFAGEAPVSNGVYYLALPNGNVFGYYSYLADTRYIYHFDMGYEFAYDPADGTGGVYFYDFASSHWWYTGRQYPFPYIYDFTLSAFLYYYPDPNNAQKYTSNPRWFYNFATGDIIQLPAPVGSALPVRGLWTQIERRGWASEYWPGQIVQEWSQFDSVVGSTPGAEAALQLDQMRAMGVNTITVEIRSADNVVQSTGVPTCLVGSPLGMQYPQPTATETAGLRAYLDLAQSKGVSVVLLLTNMHMEESPPANNTTWLTQVLGPVINHPALKLVSFNGDVHLNDFGGVQSCGGEAEPPLWLGINAQPAQYVQWAVGYAHNQLGAPWQKLSAEAIVGDYAVDSSSHLTSPIIVLKQIFDALGVPDAQRTYALSFYEHRKCSDVSGACSDLGPDAWADQTLQFVYSTIGHGGAHVVATEMGNNSPVDPAWSTPKALASLLTILKKYGADGGCFWRWTSFSNSEDTDPTLADPIKRRGVAFVYNPVQSVLVEYYTQP